MTFHILFDQSGPQISLEAAANSGPAVDSLDDVVERLQSAQEVLRTTPIDDLIGLCDAAAKAWTRPNHPLCDFIRRQGLGFLPLWMRRHHLTALCSNSMRGDSASLDGFVPVNSGSSGSFLFRAQPRGLVVHWLAGNVPVVGLLSFLQSFLSKNINILKVAAESAGALPHLLNGFNGIEYTNALGHTISGDVLTNSVAAIYIDRHNRAAAESLSALADVRVAWGGREAVETIMNLPRRFGTEDVIFGPKLSFVIVGRERLVDLETARPAANGIARDASAFDQQGCNSPHTVFVERGGAVTPSQFASLLAEAMDAVHQQLPLGPSAAARSMNILAVRTEYDMRGESYYSKGAGWSVLYSDEDAGLADPFYERTVFVRPIEDVFEVAELCSHNTQSAGLAVDDRRHELADALTARGVERCPDVGNMRLYEAPWDGMFPMERLVRWVSTY